MGTVSNSTSGIDALFTPEMSSIEAQRAFFEYAATHKGEDLAEVKSRYREVVHEIIERELADDPNCFGEELA